MTQKVFFGRVLVRDCHGKMLLSLGKSSEVILTPSETIELGVYLIHEAQEMKRGEKSSWGIGEYKKDG